LMPPGAYERRRNAFLALTVCGFLAPGFWWYALPAAAVVLVSGRRESNVPALFLALLFVVPPAGARIPGLGLINFLLQLDHPRLLAVLLLLPLAVALHRKPSAPGPQWPDRLFAAYLLLLAGLEMARGASLTSSLRGAVYLLIDAFLPYYVMSRAFTDTEKLKDVLATFCLSGTVLAAIGIFEALKHWLLYRALLDRWSADFGMGNYMLREGLIRATATTGQPIVLGYVLMVAFACLLALRNELRSGLHTKLLFALLLAGLFVTLSRGPWVGTAVTAFGFWATANASRMRMGLALGGVGVLATIFNHQLPSISLVQNVDPGTVQYRSDLLTQSIQVFSEQPWLGSDNFLQRLAAKGMLQGEGIVDIVNTYIGVALSSGAVGLALFVALFASVLLGLLRAKRRYDDEEAHALANGARAEPVGGTPGARLASPFSPQTAARALFASVLGIGVTIGTVSSISVIPWVYWTWIGIAVAFMRMAVRAKSERTRRPAANSTDPETLSSMSRYPAKLS
jgi:O-antigen ligase